MPLRLQMEGRQLAKYRSPLRFALYATWTEPTAVQSILLKITLHSAGYDDVRFPSSPHSSFLSARATEEPAALFLVLQPGPWTAPFSTPSHGTETPNTFCSPALALLMNPVARFSGLC